jgi:hypothetical protein
MNLRSPRLLAATLALAAGMALPACSDSVGAKVGPAANLAIVGGNGQSGAVGTVLAQPLVVKVTDAKGRAVKGAQVTWSTPAGNGTVAPATVATDTAGQAMALWTLPATTGTMTATATVAGLAPVTFTATSTAGPVTQLDTLPAGTTTQGGTLTLQVRARDAQGNPAAGVTVTWAVVDGGGSVPATSVTDASGIATAAWTTGTAALTQAVSARAGSAAPALFVRTLDAPAASTTLVKVSGDGQQVVVHTRPSPLAVRFAQPHAAGTIVQWAAYAGGSATPFENVSVPTDADGVSRYAWQELNVPNQEALPAIRVVASYGGSQQEFNTTLVAGPPSTVRANSDTVRLFALGQTAVNNGFLFFHSGINGLNLNDRSQWTWTQLDNNGAIAIEQSGSISRFVRAVANGTARVEAALNPAVFGAAYADTIGHDTFTVVVRQMLARAGFQPDLRIVARLGVGQTATPVGFDAGVPPLQAPSSISDVVWTSSDPAVARVDGGTTITALAPGIAVIHGTAGGATRTLYVVVTP